MQKFKVKGDSVQKFRVETDVQTDGRRRFGLSPVLSRSVMSENVIVTEVSLFHTRGL